MVIPELLIGLIVPEKNFGIITVLSAPYCLAIHDFGFANWSYTTLADAFIKNTNLDAPANKRVHLTYS